MTSRALRRKPTSMRMIVARAGIAPSLSALILLAACNGADSAQPPHAGTENAATAPVAAPESDGTRAIPCGPRAGAPDQSCQLEVEDRSGTLHLTLRQPEGGFHRLVWPKGGVLAPADGAEPLETTALNGGGVEARIGGWRYRIEKTGGGLP